MSLIEAFTAWIARNIIADDPRPEYSKIDRADGLDRLH